MGASECGSAARRGTVRGCGTRIGLGLAYATAALTSIGRGGGGGKGEGVGRAFGRNVKSKHTKSWDPE